MTKRQAAREREHKSNVSKLANTYARAFNVLMDRRGLDLPLELSMKLVDLFQDAIYTGEALQRDYGLPQTADAVARPVANQHEPSTRV